MVFVPLRARRPRQELNLDLPGRSRPRWPFHHEDKWSHRWDFRPVFSLTGRAHHFLCFGGMVAAAGLEPATVCLKGRSLDPSRLPL